MSVYWKHVKQKPRAKGLKRKKTILAFTIETARHLEMSPGARVGKNIPLGSRVSE